jgi:spore coat protein H
VRDPISGDLRLKRTRITLVLLVLIAGGGVFAWMRLRVPPAAFAGTPARIGVPRERRDPRGPRVVITVTPPLGEALPPAPPPSPTPPPAGPKADTVARIETGLAKVFDLSVLHRIEVEIAAADVPAVEKKDDARVRASFTFDGVVLKDVGVRQSGGGLNPFFAITQKPSLSLKFDEFDAGQTLFGLKRLVLKNELQDLSLVNEHLAYEVFRRAGIEAPLTAHARVTINGIDSGIYLLREPIAPQFLTRHFGKENSQGNLYELELARGDFVGSAARISLKDEAEDERDRADLLRLAATIRSATPQDFAANVSPLFDLDRYITYYAVEAVISDFDGFSYLNNNSYLSALPPTGRFVLIPYGADEAFWAANKRVKDPFQMPRSTIARMVRTIPELDARFRAEVARIGRAPFWDEQLLLARVEQVAKLLAEAPRTGRTALDLARFEAKRPIVEGFIRNGGTTRNTATLPR